MLAGIGTLMALMLILKHNMQYIRRRESLEELIDKDYLNNIYIDRAEGRVKILSEEKGGLKLINGYRFVTCKSCGASNRITGSAEGKRCSYCKAPLTESTEIKN